MKEADPDKSSGSRRLSCTFLNQVMGNSSRPSKKVALAGLALTTIAVLALAAALVAPPSIRADNDDKITTLTIDVSQIRKSNAQNDVDPAEGDQTFSRGDTFIIAGTIYQGNTLEKGEANNNPNDPGIGKYEIRGTNTAGPEAPTIAFATELFFLPDDASSILIDGLWPNEGFSAHRIVLGGTGRFRYAAGEAFEENLGRNRDGFCNLRVTFRLRKTSGRHDC